jgi:hypothetical protein
MSEMKTLKVKEDWFVPWILEEYSANQIMEAWECGSSPREHVLDVAGLMPINHIQNWEEVKEHFSKGEIEEGYIEEWDDFEIEWV